MENKKWTASWGNAISVNERRPENYGRNLTLRYPVKIMLTGEKIRIALDNFCGFENTVLTKASAARSMGDDKIDPSSIVPVTFGGCESAELPSGGKIFSDPIPLSVRRGEEITISLYFRNFTELRSAVAITGPLSRGYFAEGDQTQLKELDMNTSKKTSIFYFLSDIEVLTDESCRTVICYGDSITAQAWPDHLMEEVLSSDMTNTAVVRKAASGTRILRQYDNITYDSYGLKGSVRFPREIMVNGADTVIIQHGINDIIHPVGVEVNKFRPWEDLPTVEELARGIRMYIDAAKKAGLKIYLGTLLPIEGWRTYAPFREELRQGFNDWIRSVPDVEGVIDFDAAVRDPENPSAFDKGCDSGDHLHPSDAAYIRMAKAAASKLF